MKKSESFNERHNIEKNIDVEQHLIEGPIGKDDNNITESAQESSVYRCPFNEEAKSLLENCKL